MFYKKYYCTHATHNRHGFTIIELLMTIGIISILIGLILPALAGVRASARDTACMVEMRQLSTKITMYADDSQGYVPFLYTQDLSTSQWVAPNGTPVPDGYLATAADFWAYPMLDDFGNSFINELLLCPNDRVSVAASQWIASELNIPAENVSVPLVRSISRAFYYSPSYLREDGPSSDIKQFRVAKLSDVTFPSAKAFLVEDQPFHDDFYIDDEFLVHAPMPYHLMIVASDLSVQLRSIADAEPTVLKGSPPTGVPDIDEYQRIQRLLGSFHFTKLGVNGRDW